MTKAECSKLLAILAAGFPKFEVDELKVTVWHEMLSDIDYSVASVAAKKIILEKTFPPSIAEFREAVTFLTSPQIATGIEAWGEVKQAIRKFGYYREEEALESMSESTRQTVKHLGWRELCMSEDPEGVIRGQFVRLYEQVAGKEKQQAILPESLKEAMTALIESATLPQLEGK